MMARAGHGANRGRASFAWAVIFSLLLVFAGAQSRPSGLIVQPALASLAAAQGDDTTSILTSLAKKQRAPEQRQAGDPDHAALVCAPPIAAFDGLLATVACLRDAPRIADASRRPEARAPPLS